MIPGAIDRSEKLTLPSTVAYYQKMEDELFVILLSINDSNNYCHSTLNAGFHKWCNIVPV